MSEQPDNHLNTTFRIEPPIGRQKSFRIRYKSPDTDEKWTKLELPEIALANELFASGTVDYEHTKAKLKLILKEQYAHRDRKKKKAPFMSKNLELVDQLWKEKYTCSTDSQRLTDEASVVDIVPNVYPGSTVV